MAYFCVVVACLIVFSSIVVSYFSLSVGRVFIAYSVLFVTFPVVVRELWNILLLKLHQLLMLLVHY